MLNFLELSKGVSSVPQQQSSPRSVQNLSPILPVKIDRFERLQGTLEAILRAALKNENALGKGKEATAYQMASSPNLVLRALTDRNWQDTDLSRMKEIAVEYPKGILEHPCLGVPVTVIVPEEHKLAQAASISPEEASQAELSFVKKMQGVHPNHLYQTDAFRIRGWDRHGHPEEASQEEIYDYFRQQFVSPPTDGTKERVRKLIAGREFLKAAQNGVYEVSKGTYRNGNVPAYTKEQQMEFAKNLSEFGKSYTKQLAEIANMEHSAYEEAVQAWKLVRESGYTLDFRHALNTFVDTKNHRISFIDLQLNPNSPDFQEYAKSAGLGDFVKVLAGQEAKGFNPWEHVIDEEQYEQVEQHLQTIVGKVSNAAKKHGISDEIRIPGSFYSGNYLKLLLKRL